MSPSPEPPTTDSSRADELAYLQRTIENLSRSLDDLLALKESSRQLLTADTRDTILEALLTVVRKILGEHPMRLYVRDEKAGPEELQSYHPAAEGPDLLPELDVLDWVVEKGEPATIPLSEERFTTVLPLKVHEHPVGLLTIATDELGESITPHMLEQLSLVGAQAAISLLNESLLRQLRAQYRAIERSRAYLNNILDSINNGIVSVDTQGCITQINRNATAMLDLAVPDPVGLPLAEVLPASVRATFQVVLQETFEQGFAMERLIQHETSMGTLLPLAISTSVLRQEETQIQGAIILLRDMTASQELERLRHIDRMKSEFVANVSHELRTPLTSIRAYTEALEDMIEEDETQKSFLKVIESESDRLLFLIENLLNLSRIESGKLVLDMDYADPGELLDSIKGISKLQSEKHQVLFRLAPELPKTFLDVEKIKEVLINLVSNAIKYSPDGGEVTARVEEFEGNIRYTVRDQGMGISEEHLPHVFDQFYRVDTSLTYKVSGTGLGLAIARNIVEAHDGTIMAESEEGKGSTFTVLLPIRQAPKEQEERGLDG